MRPALAEHVIRRKRTMTPNGTKQGHSRDAIQILKDEHRVPQREHDISSGALGSLLACLSPVDGEEIDLFAAGGRVLASPLVADRDSPPCDVSQMDGYAVRAADLGARSLPVKGEAAMGRPPVLLPAASTVRIFTGAPIPRGADTIVPREDVTEQGETINLSPGLTDADELGRFIRRQGENLAAGSTVVDRGSLITPAIMAALSSFGVDRPSVHRRVRVSLLVTGNEVLKAGDRPEPWQIRDANGAGLHGLLSRCPWLNVLEPSYVKDEVSHLREAIARLTSHSDAILTTGGVSMGQYDHVPDVIRSLGGHIVFHKLPIRPGKPVLGAVGPEGQLVMGLPGNPVSTMVTARRLAVPALRRLAGLVPVILPVQMIRLANPDEQSLPLDWFRLVRLTGPGEAELVMSRGSGDLVSMARSDGFVEVPAGMQGEGPWPFHAWEG